MNKIKTIVASLVLLMAVAPTMAGPVMSGKADQMGNEVRVGWKWQLGKQDRQIVPADYVDPEQITYASLGGSVDDLKPKWYKAKWFWISAAVVAGVFVVGENNDWSFSSDSNDSASNETDNRSLAIDIATGATVGDDINISNLIINNFSTPESSEEE